MFLKNTDYDIHIVFNDDGLLKKDQDLNENFKTLCENANHKYNQRVFYQTDLARKSGSSKKSLMIIDESHAKMYGDLMNFYKSTKHEKVLTICLTATPFEGKDDGIHMAALQELGYKVYKNSDKQEDYEP